MRKAKGGGRSSNGGLLPNSLKIISSCLKTVSTNASTVVRSAGATVAASIAATPEVEKDQVLWAGFDKLELSPTAFRHILLLGYSNGFQIIDVEDASNYRELVSKRDGPVTFLQMQPIPISTEVREGFRAFHPLLLVVAGDEAHGSNMVRGPYLNGAIRNGTSEPQLGNSISMPTVVRFYSLKSDNYVHVLRFRSAVRLIRCSPRIIAVALASQIYCFDAVTLENKFSVLTYPIPHGGDGVMGVNTGYGPMSVGPRWLAYASNSHIMLNTGRLSPQNLTPSPGVSPSTSPSSGSLVARYAVESSKHLAAGIISLGDMGYKTLSKYCQELLPDGSNSPIPSNASWKVSRVASSVHPSETDNAGMVVIKDFVSKDIISQFRAHTSPLSALCFDPSGTLLVTASVHGNNINVFRIIPSSTQNGSNSGHYDWSTSHVHLYKLYRGLTTAQPRSPPPPLTLSVVGRMKNGSGGWLNTVSNAAALATGKLPVPSGAVTAVFHNSIRQSVHPVHSLAKSLEHLLVYSPSGHVIQHELLLSSSIETCESNSQTGPGPYVPVQEEELRVKAEPVQWWDVCRRLNWPERDESLSSVTSGRLEMSEVAMDFSDFEDNITKSSKVVNDTVGGKDTAKTHEKSYWYLSNAEVQISTGRVPLWQKSKIGFYSLMPLNVNEWKLSNDRSGGEIEIEKFPVHEVEIKRKDLVPVFKHLQCIQPDWKDRSPHAPSLPLLKEMLSSIPRLSPPRERWQPTPSIQGEVVHMCDCLDLVQVCPQPARTASSVLVLPRIVADPPWITSMMCSAHAKDGCVAHVCLGMHPSSFTCPPMQRARVLQLGWCKVAISGLVGVRYSSATSLDCHQTEDKFLEDMVIRRSSSVSSGSTERPCVGKNVFQQKSHALVLGIANSNISTNLLSALGPVNPTENLLDLDDTNGARPCEPIKLPSVVKPIPQGSVMGHHQLDTSLTMHTENSDHGCMPFLSGISKLDNGCGINGPSPLDCDSPCLGRQLAKDALSSNNAVRSELSNSSGSNPSASSPNMNAESGHVNIPNSVDFAQYFHEGYCKISELDDCRELTEVVTDADSSSSHCERDKPDEDGDNDDLLGGMFAFSEEGRNPYLRLCFFFFVSVILSADYLVVAAMVISPIQRIRYQDNEGTDSSDGKTHKLTSQHNGEDTDLPAGQTQLPKLIFAKSGFSSPLPHMYML
ncbi:hypothetical protein ACLOJK_018096 [Asimina triloba]